MWQDADLLVILDHGAPLQTTFLYDHSKLFFLQDMIDLRHYK